VAGEAVLQAVVDVEVEVEAGGRDAVQVAGAEVLDGAQPRQRFAAVEASGVRP
jgi:hypothetical protein